MSVNRACQLGLGCLNLPHSGRHASTACSTVGVTEPGLRPEPRAGSVASRNG